MAMNSFGTDIQLEYKFDRIIKAILGNFFITKDVQQDLKQATDFLIYSVSPFKVGVRLRRHKYFLNKNYRSQFTIRWTRPSGCLTEIDKIKNSLVDFILYGFLNKDEDKIIQYFIGDLKIFREHFCPPLIIKDNSPYDSKLAIWNFKQFPKDFIKFFYPKR